jgi:hypothetical protein
MWRSSAAEPEAPRRGTDAHTRCYTPLRHRSSIIPIYSFNPPIGAIEQRRQIRLLSLCMYAKSPHWYMPGFCLNRLLGGSIAVGTCRAASWFRSTVLGHTHEPSRPEQGST